MAGFGGHPQADFPVTEMTRDVAQIENLQRRRGRRQDLLHRPIAAVGEHRAQHLMALHDTLHATAEQRDVERPLETPGAGDVVNRTGRLPLLQKPQALLGE